MQKSVYITRFISGLLLIVFTISITPKRFLHEMFAEHIDNRPAKNNGKPYQLGCAGYNCDSENLVAESNFVSDQQIFSFPAFTSFPVYIFQLNSFSSAVRIYSRLRGPPLNS